MSKPLSEKIKLIRNTKKFFKVASGKSYYPECKRKSCFERFSELLKWSFKYKEVNDTYNLYALDIDGTDTSGYIDAKTFMRTRDKMNGVRDNKKQYNYIVLLRDKYVFYKFLKSLNIPTPYCIGVTGHGKTLILDDKLERNNSDENIEIFIKKINGECANDIILVRNDERIKQIIAGLPKSESYVLQQKLEQHDQMNKIYSSSVNTIRLVTIFDGKEAKVFSAVLRCGTSLSGYIDNFARGGLAIGINEFGKLRQEGFFKQHIAKKTTIHPDTGIKFKDVQIPYYQEALEMALHLHTMMSEIPSIGWDIAITPIGPCFIEGNDNWEIGIMQACNGGLKDKWLAFCEIYKVSR